MSGSLEPHDESAPFGLLPPMLFSLTPRSVDAYAPPSPPLKNHASSQSADYGDGGSVGPAGDGVGKGVGDGVSGVGGIGVGAGVAGHWLRLVMPFFPSG